MQKKYKLQTNISNFRPQAHFGIVEKQLYYYFTKEQLKLISQKAKNPELKEIALYLYSIK